MAVLLLLCGLTACSSHDPGTLLGKADSGHLTIGIRFDQPGLAEHTLDGRFVGFDVDVAEYVAGQLGVKPPGIIWRETTSATRETDLTSGTVDLVIAAYSITDKRKQVISFAGPYFETGQDLLVRRSDNAITGPETLNGRRLCSVTGSTPAQEVKTRFAQAVQLVEYPRYPDCVTALLAGQVDAVTTDGVILAGYVTQNPELLKVVGKPFSTERYGIGLRKGDAEGLHALDDAIQQMVSSGKWLDSLRVNLGPSGYPLPAPPAVTER
ncbi:glutamate ABC transporter substrate-binding protein [Amycolatopsis acidiphila]|uniref:Glutamate ABC transporter substrate-binding protein n=1 Tax=Amycolatopsis acidiphila TaxID=715473 RepID=A0A558AI78_9PSEU|nr:glutamate ABC transporter substrate-binding protein [Amycolatopsis acidiphila]TVT23939.1 glutamate ABC transporter substrate-binding protein [Amycolatopsis acidiphila]UIJ63764.1 glutamate ABC transporter substrate-binding protein [Amycolatopsis acidiphila]